ncbi:MAG: hypothetical protein PHN22_00185 [Candidatus ainarchaeum sp.]|nr:hypothetical protein [Candidatus ainarchaeum sp.]
MPCLKRTVSKRLQKKPSNKKQEQKEAVEKKLHEYLKKKKNE